MTGLSEYIRCVRRHLSHYCTA